MTADRLLIVLSYLLDSLAKTVVFKMLVQQLAISGVALSNTRSQKIEVLHVSAKGGFVLPTSDCR